jgi:hypothetical protein
MRWLQWLGLPELILGLLGPSVFSLLHFFFSTKEDRHGYIAERIGRVIMSWMDDKKKFSAKEREKLEKGSGFIKLWTLVCNWFYRAVSW